MPSFLRQNFQNQGIFHTLYLWNEVGDPNFFLHFWHNSLDLVIMFVLWIKTHKLIAVKVWKIYALEHDFRTNRKFQNGSRERSLEAVDLRIRYVGSRIEYICYTRGDFKPETLGPHIICIIISRILKAASKTILLLRWWGEGQFFWAKTIFQFQVVHDFLFFGWGDLFDIYFFSWLAWHSFLLWSCCAGIVMVTAQCCQRKLLLCTADKNFICLCRIIFLKENMLWHENHWSVEVIINDLLSKNHILEVLLTQMTTNFTLLRYHSIILDLSSVHEKNHTFR